MFEQREEAQPAVQHLSKLHIVEQALLLLLESDQWSVKSSKNGVTISAIVHNNRIVFRGEARYELSAQLTPEAFASLAYNVNSERCMYEPVAKSTGQVLQAYSPYCRLIMSLLISGL